MSSWILDQYERTAREVKRWPCWMREMLERERERVAVVPKDKAGE